MTSHGYTTEEGGLLNNFAVEPKVYVDDTQQFGFNEYAEKLNGRLAMIGFISAIAFEALTGHGIISWLTQL
ncbi:chlorophyll a/b-binding protein [Pseudanabaena sp. FACHB-2040]|uniref:chlorophyll a/b-binding protein n=1 Tax=Pseudanabaena sp. FACHB-2040 TaxID=2692859 RepID=UPI001685E871|nr:chlorophyll a/b-binding protein [Pseudanabaena sp. FACHB-2040]MBD0270065.1 high light inducible protein [Cyanobacteria bacterium Co-bin8]MBD2258065.1 high light inducible protein [Pseudanabaena sp. FACHB-2040]